ncbi:hypothetical protein ALP8811_03233 [Aliiroseovarius pelagivivens]|uniref:DUF6924 domain-containing protein n=1 Tax=Aliiroseovarius pelagivivens TaxID=1639690 RepID=A0A2R8ATA9_9RHOB|nr:hypothetical protein [Aliiroseovarius pelagivivens]SPF79293.1 hypothetical protein ALP8811_03233 [Aliiroseovarius pelagivivens]
MEDTTPFVRTDFSDSSKWKALLEEVSTENEMGFRAFVEPISDSRFDSADPVDVAHEYADAVVVFVVDVHTIQTGEVLCLNGEAPTEQIRAKAKDLWVVENNLSIGNLLFDELVEQVGEDGVLQSLEL